MSDTKKGTSWSTRYILRSLNKDQKEEILSYINNVNEEEYLEFSNEQQVYDLLEDIVRSYIESLTLNELSDLRFYTGYDFRNINNTMREKWLYEENGVLTKEKKNKFQKLGKSIYRIINKFPSLNIPIKAYRGVTLRAFRDYNIQSIEDLIHMEGKYIYESGFTSTSLLRSESYFNKDINNQGICNIEIEYYISEKCQDGAVLLSDVLSYSKNQMEYVINSGSLTKIAEVIVDKENNKALIKAILIPKQLWDRYEPEMDTTNKRMI